MYCSINHRRRSDVFLHAVLAFYPADIIYSFIETPGARNIENSIVNALSKICLTVLNVELNLNLFKK
jgi:hypothetical protein